MIEEDERERIAHRAALKAEKEANLTNRVQNLEEEVRDMRSAMAWGIRAIWGGAVYLVLQLWTFLSQGGSLK